MTAGFGLFLTWFAPTSEQLWAGPDDRVFALIDTARSAATSIVVDGQADPQWTSIPSWPDPVGDAADASRDIVGVTIAPLADAWLLRIETAAAPSTADLAFWLFIDYRGRERLDLELGLYLGFPDVLWVYPEDAGASVQNWDHTATVLGSSFLEVRVPLTELAAVLPSPMADDLTGTNARPWVRITALSRDTMGNIVDRAPPSAAYRLLETPYNLDGPLDTVSGEPSPAPPLVLPTLPTTQQQFVGQGAGGLTSHSAQWAYDLFQTDANLEPGSPVGSDNNSDYFSFGEPLTAPLEATAISLDNAQPDQPPLADPCAASTPNFVFLDVGSGIGLLMSHLQQGSITTSPASVVAAGDLLGTVGHSGSCSWPHLHLEAQTLGGMFPSRPIELGEVDVGLNPRPDDPWRRQVSNWTLREGVFVAPKSECSGVRVDPFVRVFCDGFEVGDAGAWQ